MRLKHNIGINTFDFSHLIELISEHFLILFLFARDILAKHWQPGQQ